MATAGNITAVLTLNSNNFQQGLTSSLEAVDKFKATFSNSIKPLSNDVEKLKGSLRLLGDSLDVASREIEKFNVNAKNLSQFNTYANAVNKLANALKILSSDTINAETGINVINNMFKQFQGVLSGTEIKIKGVATVVKELSTSEKQTSMSVAEATSIIEQNSQAMQRNAVAKLRSMGYTGTLSAEEQRLVATEEKVSVATDKATNSMNRQASASKGLSSALSSLKMMGTMVASMMVYNFAHNLITATRETVNAKSEMNGYFQMLGYTGREVDHFNQKLDEMIQKFPRINKYSLGETISSIGVEFELTTQEMEKAMPVVSMITSEYLRAGRNVNEASLAVKDILQGEFQRLSRETGVKGDQLKEAGWSGDKTDVMGLLEALDKVGHDRNWDVFVAKANSLNDAIIILQNRFGEWSADMVERIQPAIVGAFNTIMSVADIFGGMLNGVLDWLTGDAFGQGVGWTILGVHIASVVAGLIHLRTGANLTQIAQMGLTKSIGATILGLEAETVAETGLRNSIVQTITGIEAETLAEELNVSGRRARILAITSTITGLEAEEVAQIGVTKSLTASALGLDMATLKEHGFAVALAEATTQMEAQELASMGLIKQIALIGATTIPAIAVVGAFAVAFGKLAMETMDATTKMSNFYDIQQNGEKYVNEAKDSVSNLKDKIKELKNTQSKYTKGSAEYNNVGKAIDDLNGKVELANQNVKDNYEAWQMVNSAQKNYDTTKQELQLDLQQKINKSLVDTGLSEKEANELSNTYLNEAIDGSKQLYKALQSVAEQYDKQADGVASLTKYWQDKGLTPEEIKLKVDPYIDSQTNIAKDIEKMKLSTDIVEVASTWVKLQVDQVELTLKENLPKIEAGDWEGGITGMLKGLAHGLADLPVFSGFWNWVFDQFKIKETYGGKGWEGLQQFLDDSANNLKKLIFDTFVGAFTGDSDGESWGFDPVKDFQKGLVESLLPLDGIGEDIENWINTTLQPLSDALNSFFKDPLGTLGIDTSGFDIWSLFGFNTVSASDGSSDHPSIMEDISNILGFDIQTWITNFNSDPLGTLGIEIPQIDLIGMIKSLIPTGGDGGGFDLGSWLSSMFNIDGIISYFTTNLPTIVSSVTNTVNTVSGMFNNLKTNIQTHLTNIVTNVTNGFNTVKDNAVSKITAMKDSVKGVIDQMVGAWNTMKDSILNSAKKIQDGVKEKFDQVKSTIGGFYHKLTNPSEWFSGAGQKSWSSSPKPHTARKLFGVRSNGKHGAGSPDPYQRRSQTVTLDELVAQLGGNKRVNLGEFLSLFAGSGFGGWDFAKKHKDTIFNEGKKWKADSPSMNGVTLGNGFPVLRFWNGKASGFTWDEFMSVASAIFSAIPYKFYMDSDWKGNWVSALLSGAMNCSDGADALLALASLFGFSGEKVHTTLKNGTGHFYTRINGHTMDTTHFQNSGSWSPLGGAGSPPRGYSQGKTVNINVEITGTVYGVEDLDSRIQESVEKGLKAEFNDPYTIAI